jgi:hypothetical protein
MDQQQADEWTAYLQSKQFRRDARGITWPLAFGLGAGPGHFGLGFLAGWLGFKAWDAIAVDTRRHLDRETLAKVRRAWTRYGRDDPA